MVHPYLTSALNWAVLIHAKSSPAYLKIQKYFDLLQHLLTELQNENFAQKEKFGINFLSRLKVDFQDYF